MVIERNECPEMGRSVWTRVRTSFSGRRSQVLPALGLFVVIFIVYRLLDILNDDKVRAFATPGGGATGRQFVFPPQWDLDIDEHDKGVMNMRHPKLRLLDLTVPKIYNITDAAAENMFYNLLERRQVVCEHTFRVGNEKDGGWDVCMVPPFRFGSACLVYSFGIAEDWSFEDDITRKFHCKVQGFDPTINRPLYLLPRLNKFHKTGLHGFNGYTAKGEMKTLGAIVKELDHTQVAIDLLKIDIEGAEWAALEVALREGALRNVKQLAIEIHTPEVYVDDIKQGSVTKEDFVRMATILTDLERQGFKLFRHHGNPTGQYMSEHTNRQRPCCYELNYVNINFLQT